jgi:flagellar biogenesis protein FliO
MDWVAFLIFGLEGFFLLATVIVLIWLIVRRIQRKKVETFEKRDN